MPLIQLLYCYNNKLLSNVHSQTHWWDVKFCAATTASSSAWTLRGTLLQPGDLRMRSTIAVVLWTIAGVQISTLVMTTKVGTRSAMVRPKCSFVVPTKNKHTKNTLIKTLLWKDFECKVVLHHHRHHISHLCETIYLGNKSQTYARVSSNSKHCKVWWISCQTKDSCLHVFMMTS